MINDISWASYCFAIGLMLLLYYAIVIARFFKHDISTWASRLQSIRLISISKQKFDTEPSAASPSFSGLTQDHLPIVDTTDDSQIQSFLEETAAYFKQASVSKVRKSEITDALRKLLLKHGIETLRHYRPLINRIVQMHCINNCSIHLFDVDLETVWRG